MLPEATIASSWLARCALVGDRGLSYEEGRGSPGLSGCSAGGVVEAAADFFVDLGAVNFERSLTLVSYFHGGLL